MQVLKEEIRNEILLVAENMFLKQGFQKTSMKEIAGKVGISKGNLYNYYKNKEDIFNQLLSTIWRLLRSLSLAHMQRYSLLQKKSKNLI